MKSKYSGLFVRYFFLLASVAVMSFVSNGLAVPPDPDARSTDYIGMGFESPAYRYYSSPYYYIDDGGYRHLLHAADTGVGVPGDITSDQAYTGNQSLYASVNSTSVAGEESRSEIRSAMYQKLDENYYSAFAMDMDGIPGRTTIFWQSWQWSGGSPPLTLKLNVWGNYTVERNFADEYACELFSEYLPRGPWHRFFIDYKLGLNSTGHMIIWLDGVKKMHFEGTTAYDEDPDNITTKLGIYRYGPATALSGYFDDIRWGRNSNDVWYGTQYSEIPSEPSLIGHWAFDEASTNTTIAKDSSPGCSYVGELRGGAGHTQGVIGQALSLDGTNDYVSIPDSVLWDAGSNMTVSCWFKTSVNQSNKGLVVHDSSNYKYLLYLTSDSGALTFYVRTSSGVTSASINNGTGYYADGEWHHVAGVYDRNASDGNRLKLYVDGVVVGYGTGYDEDILDGDEGIYVGRWASYYFDGSVDDVRVYNYGLSEKELSLSNLSDCIGHWRFEDSGDRVADDSSVFNNAGLLMYSGIDWCSGYVGSALTTTTNSYLHIPDSPIWDVKDKLTVSCRFKTSDNQSYKGLVVLDNSEYKYLLYLTSESGSLIFYIRTSDGVAGVSVKKSPGYYADGNWHHVTGVYDRNASDGNRLKIYVDGVLAGTASGADADIITGGGGIDVGRFSTFEFDGDIDDVAIYRAALTGAQVEYMYAGPICYYDFDEGQGTIATDSSYQDCDRAILQNGASWGTNGYSGSEIMLDGINDYASVPDSSLWDVQDKVTVSCKFKTSANQTSQGLVVHDNSDYKYMLYLTSDSGGLTFLVRTASGIAFVSINNGSGYYADNMWHHVAGVYDRNVADGNRLKLYVDGVLVALAVGDDADIANGDEGVYIGRWGTRYFTGSIDDVIIYNRAVTDVEITEFGSPNPATIIGHSIFSNHVMEIVVNIPCSPSNCWPKATTSLESGIWESVMHSDNGVNAFVITNFDYSTSDATGSNKVIYVDTSDALKFFSIDNAGLPYHSRR